MENEDMAIIISVRMSSKRLPGKVLKDLCGTPLLKRIIDNLSHCQNCETIIVSTSDESSDDPIAGFCSEWGVRCFRGDLDNVAKRFLDTIRCYGLKSFVRVSGDSPLLDWRLIDQAIALFRGDSCDMVTNILHRTFPHGMSIEVFDSNVFSDAFPHFNSEDESEHVTPYFYKNSEDFSICSFTHSPPCSDMRLVVDTHEDFSLVTSIIESLDKPVWAYSLDEIIQFYHAARKTEGGPYA